METRPTPRPPGGPQAHDPDATGVPVQAFVDTGAGPPAPGAAVPLPPELAGHPDYEVLRELGRGGMGVVYLAKHRLSGRLEVLKVMKKSLLEQAGSKERFLREIQSAARLDHKNIVKMYTALERGELLVLVMEYVDGEDLAAVVQVRGPLPVLNACYYVQQAALGLQHAHEKGMVHRDIKPQNLILAKDGRKHTVKVLDFGLAKATHADGTESGLTGTGAMMGTPAYLAPEQSLDAASADIRADIYSLGCTLYHLLAGNPPFSGRSMFEIIQAHHSSEARPLNAIRPEVPAELAAVVRRMMSKEASQRYQTPAEVVKALTPFVKGTLGAMPPTQAAPQRGPQPAVPPPTPQKTVVEDSAAIARAGKPTARRNPVDQTQVEVLPRRSAAGSGKAITSLVLGALSLFGCSFLAGLPSIVFGLLALRDIGGAAGRLAGKPMAILGIVLGSLGTLCWPPGYFFLIRPGVQRVQDAADRSVATNNLRLMGIAMHSYHDMYNVFPSPGVGYPGGAGGGGNPLQPPKERTPYLSWRVALLPFVEEVTLYKQFNFDEPWDGPNNIKLLGQMPKIFRTPGDEQTPPDHTRYQVFVGNGAAFDQNMAFPLRRTLVTDGTSQTILIAEAARPVPWTRPDDIPFDPNQPIAPLLYRRSNGLSLVVMADGTVKTIQPEKISQATLKAAVTASAGDMLGSDWP